VAPDIGLVPYPFETEIRMLVPEDFADFPPARPPGGHKGTFGHLAIIAGSVGYHGAAVLAARGAQRAQPGLITLFIDERIYEPVAQQLQSVMVQPWPAKPKLPESCTAVLFGPGLASPTLRESVKQFCQDLWQESALPVIADASGLDWLPPGPCLENTLRVITPHPGEAARLLKKSTGDVQADRFLALRDLSKRFGHCQVVLKGYQTVIGSHEPEAFVNSSGNPYLAQGGSGDLLAGFLGGLLAQPALQKEMTQTICYAVWQHGAAADALLATRPNWTVEELADVLGSVPAQPAISPPA
jgi:NAD(P)H-hydrate epimerase